MISHVQRKEGKKKVKTDGVKRGKKGRKKGGRKEGKKSKEKRKGKREPSLNNMSPNQRGTK